MQKALFVFFPILALAGCSGEEKSDNPMTTEQMVQKAQDNKASMPPEAQAAMEKSGRYGGANSEYAKSMEQAQKR